MPSDLRACGTGQDAVTAIVRNPTFAAGIGQVLEEAGAAVRIATAGGVSEAVAQAAGLDRGLLLLDAQLPENAALAVCRRLSEEHPEVPVLTLSDADWDVLLAAAWDAGAEGFLLQQAPPDELREAVASALQGRNLFTAKQGQRVREWHRT